MLEYPQEVKIKQYSPGESEDTNKVLLSECVDANFHSYRSIVLGQNRGGYADQPDAPVRYRSCIAGRVNHRSTTNRHNVGVTINFFAVYPFQNLIYKVRARFGLLPAGHDHRVFYQINP